MRDSYVLLHLVCSHTQDTGQFKAARKKARIIRQTIPSGGLSKDPGFVIGVTHDRDGNIAQALQELGRQADDVCFVRVEEGKRGWRLYSTHGSLAVGDSGNFSEHHPHSLQLGLMDRKLQQKRLDAIKGLPKKPVKALPEDVLCVGDFSHFLDPDKVICALEHLFKGMGVERCEFVDYGH